MKCSHVLRGGESRAGLRREVTFYNIRFLGSKMYKVLAERQKWGVQNVVVRWKQFKKKKALL
jgi:hypothetical protein